MFVYLFINLLIYLHKILLLLHQTQDLFKNLRSYKMACRWKASNWGNLKQSCSCHDIYNIRSYFIYLLKSEIPSMLSMTK